MKDTTEPRRPFCMGCGLYICVSQGSDRGQTGVRQQNTQPEQTGLNLGSQVKGQGHLTHTHTGSDYHCVVVTSQVLTRGTSAPTSESRASLLDAGTPTGTTSTASGSTSPISNQETTSF